VTASETETPPALNHALARKRWGAPDAWEGNVNDPRTREEHGIRFNEKWIYHLADGALRFVYWHRYGLRGVLVKDADGQVRPEPV
jgi:hypothetical protein